MTQTELVAAAGDYVVGFIVEDLDGNDTASYALVKVVEQLSHDVDVLVPLNPA